MPENEVVTAVLDRPGKGSALVERLEATRADVHAYRRVHCLVKTILVALLLAALLAAADWLWILGTVVRTGGLLLIAGVAIFLLAHGFRSRRKFGRPDAAVEVETAFPQLG